MSDAWDGLPPEEWRTKIAPHWFRGPRGETFFRWWYPYNVEAQDGHGRWDAGYDPGSEYLGPVLVPDEVAALRARAERAEMCVRTARAKALREAVEIIRSRVQVRIEPHFRAAASKIEAGIARGMAAMADDVAAAISDLIMRTVPKEKPMERDDGGPAEGA